MAAVSLPKCPTPENDALISRFTDYLATEKGLAAFTTPRSGAPYFRYLLDDEEPATINPQG
jgi:hypothetical protein